MTRGGVFCDFLVHPAGIVKNGCQRVDRVFEIVALQLLPCSGMANDLEQLLHDVFGEPLNKLNQFQAEQVKKLQARLQELARESVKDELTKLHAEITEIRNRVATLEAERAQAAAESVDSSF